MLTPVCILLPATSAAQEVTPVSLRKSSVKAYPYAYYTPETQLAFGVGGIMTFYAGRDSVLRPSSVTLSGYYTSNDQWTVGLTPKIYYAGNRRYISAPASFGHYQSKFWGIGNDTPDTPDSPYLEDVADVRFEIQWPPVFPVFDRSGAIYHFAHNDIVDREQNPFLMESSTRGVDAGTLSGVGVTFVKDSRNETFYPDAGRFYTISYLYYANGIGSDYEFSHWTFDLRQYLLAWGKWGAFALQIYGEFVAGNAPFYKLPALGGSNRMRGYFYGRFRDKTYLMAQGEYRRHLGWKLGGVAFTGVGQVAPDLGSYGLGGFHVSWGLGLRYLFNPEEHVNIRLDWGNGSRDNTTGIYFAVEEAF